eukprot:373237-Prymnesium_polylepis.1
MAQGCAAAEVRSGERGRHSVYLESAVQRTCETPKGAVTVLSQMPRGLRHCELAAASSPLLRERVPDVRRSV